jgi:hypothetical protein
MSDQIIGTIDGLAGTVRDTCAELSESAARHKPHDCMQTVVRG